MHFSQVPSAFESSLDHDVDVDPGREAILRVALRGFIDAGMLRERLEGLAVRIDRRRPDAVLVDLRHVAGYGPGTPTLARDGLALARRAGVRRVALLVSSSVVRIAAQLLARNLDLELRCFPSEPAARRWLAVVDTSN
ncbi:hypothetical protein PPSIR1_15290 [Plesiocystis pacifica SIR-1]|uniref:STAS domain-containing protein n=1 Tax=Plesiocystis pacifica SIR-1 TaxID=391625 RepID=A6GFI3_9BACT|nr:STAS/SEC14 domain-containing protein [Plesiocystis pacifica]EDM75355.1 hypothetical protein PPSIR1_15290 [Plesiocystis pacifica SIR-1]